MVFVCRVRGKDGVTRTMRREGESASSVAAALRAEGLLVLGVDEGGRSSGAASGNGQMGGVLPMTSLDVELGLRQLASMISSGVSLLLALKTVAEQARRARAKRVWDRIEAQVRTGMSLSDAMSAFPHVFDVQVVQLMRVGEQSGELDVAMVRAADQLEAHRSLRMMVVNAMTYPILALLMAIGVSVFLVVSVIPKIGEFLKGTGAALPPVTQALMDLSQWVRENGLYVLAVLAALVAVWWVVRCTKLGREHEDAFLLKLPIAGNILRLSGTAIFARGMGLLIESGVTLLDALDVVSKLLQNKRLARRIDTARLGVMQGRSLAESLSDAPEFMPMLSRMTAVAETTGSLSATFNEVARFHESLLTLAIKRFSTMIEPVMIVVTGGIVGFVYIAFFVALFSMAGAV